MMDDTVEIPSLSLDKGEKLLDVCIKSLEEFIDEEGIFRVQASEKEVAACFADICNDSYGSIEDADDHNVVACVLKRYFRLLPEPVLTSALYDEFLSAMQPSSTDARVEALKSLVVRLPEPNRSLVGMVVPFLHRVSERSDKNRMSAQAWKDRSPSAWRVHMCTLQNLGVIFGQSLLWPSSLDKTLIDAKTVPNAFTCCFSIQDAMVLAHGFSRIWVGCILPRKGLFWMTGRSSVISFKP
jgi:hypothetical protein